jgi:hypothetical protein
VEAPGLFCDVCKVVSPLAITIAQLSKSQGEGRG